MACTFCDIIEGRERAALVYEDSSFVAFMDKHPINAGHLLVSPKHHYENLLDMPLQEVGCLFTTVAKLAKAVKKAVRADGFHIGQNNGEAASQIVPHVHVHIIPRFFNDLPPAKSPIRKTTTYMELRNIAKGIEKEFKADHCFDSVTNQSH